MAVSSRQFVSGLWFTFSQLLQGTLRMFPNGCSFKPFPVMEMLVQIGVQDRGHNVDSYVLLCADMLF